MKSLKLALILAGYPEKDMFSHESDLYVFKTKLSTDVIKNWCKENNFSLPWTCPTFTDAITGRIMYDCAFQNYLPLAPWDGTDGHGQHLVNPHVKEGLLIDDDGNVYYRSRDTHELNTWCPASRLSAHIHHLNQIEWRK